MLETPSIRRYSLMSRLFSKVLAWEVRIRSVRTISRKDSGLKVAYCCRQAGESSETKRRPSHSFIGSRYEMKLWSGPYGDVGRSAETSGPLISQSEND